MIINRTKAMTRIQQLSLRGQHRQAQRLSQVLVCNSIGVHELPRTNQKVGLSQCRLRGGSDQVDALRLATLLPSTLSQRLESTVNITLTPMEPPAKVDLSLQEPKVASDQAEDKQLGFKVLKQNLEGALIAAESLRGKDAIMLVGKTGAGKSTMSNILAGRQIDLITEVKNQNPITSLYVADPVFKVSSEVQSATRVLQFYDVEKEEFTIVDTMGFKDTKGPEYDIPNTIGLCQALNNLEFVKFMLVIEQSTILQSRGDSIREIISQYLGYFTQFKAEVIAKATILCITKASPKNIKKPVVITQRIQALSKDENENLKMKEFLSLLRNKLVNDKSQDFGMVQLFSLQSMAETTYQCLQKKLNKVKSLKNTAGKFDFGLSEGSKLYLANKINKIQNNILSYCADRRFEQLFKRLSELKYLGEQLRLPVAQAAISKSLASVEKALKSTENQFYKHVDLMVSGQMNESTKEEALAMIRTAKSMKQLEKLGGAFSKITLETKFVEYILSKVVAIVKRLSEPSCDYSVSQKKQFYSKARSLAMSFGSLDQKLLRLWEDTRQSVKGNFQSLANSIIKDLKEGDYSTIAAKLAQIQSNVPIAEECGIVVGQTIIQLRQAIHQSLVGRFQGGFKLLSTKLTNKEDVVRFKSEYHVWRNLIRVQALQELLGQRLIEQVKNFSSVLVQACKSLLDKLNAFISNNELDDRFPEYYKLLGQLRELDSKVAQATGEELARLKRNLQLQLSKNSKQAIEEVMAKFKLGTIKKEDLTQISEVLQGLNQKPWLKQITGEAGIMQTITKTKLHIQRYAKSLVQQIPDIFESQLAAGTGNFSDSSSNQQRVFNRHFKHLNCTLEMIDSLVQQNLCEKELQVKAKATISQIVKGLLDMVTKGIQRNKTKLETAKLGKNLPAVKLMSKVRGSNAREIRAVLQDAEHVVREYIESRLEQFDQLGYDLKIKSELQSLVLLFDDLRMCRSAFEDVDVQELEESYKNKLREKLELLRESVQASLRNNDIKSAKEDCTRLKAFRNTKLNNYMQQQLRQVSVEIENAVSSRQKDISGTGMDMLKSKRFDDLVEFIPNSKNSGNPTEYGKLINQVVSHLQNSFSLIQEETQEMATFTDVRMRKFGTLLKDFKTFSPLKEHITQFNIVESIELTEIAVHEQFAQIQKAVREQILSHRFANLNQRIQFYKKLGAVLNLSLKKKVKLLDLENSLLLPEVLKLDNTPIKQGGLNEVYSSFSKLKEYDAHSNNSTGHAPQLKNKLTTFVHVLTTDVKRQLSNCRKMTQLKQIKLGVENLSFQVRQLPKEFVEVENLIFHTLTTIQHYQQALSVGAQFSKEHFQNIRLNKPSEMKAAINNFKAKLQAAKSKMEDSLKHNNYQQAHEQLLSFSKYEDAIAFLGGDLQKFKLKNLQHICSAKTVEQCSRVQTAFRIFASSKKVTNSDSLAPLEDNIGFFLRLKNDKQISAKRVAFSQALSDLLASAIPDMPLNVNMTQLCNYQGTLKKHSNLISLSKKFAAGLREIDHPDQRGVLALIDKIPTPQNFEEVMKKSLDNIGTSMKDSLANQKYKDSSKLMIDLKRSALPESQSKFRECAQMVNSIRKDKGEEVRNYVENQDLQKIQTGVRRLSQLEGEFKPLLELKEKDLIHKQIQKEVLVKINEELFKPAIVATSKQETEEAVDKLMKLRKWGNISFVEGKSNQHISEVLRSSKKNNIIGKVQKVMEKLSSDKENAGKATICSEIMANFSKELQIPLIYPKVTKSIQTVMKEFKGDYDQKELLKVYDMFMQEYEQLKKEFISGSTEKDIEANQKLAVANVDRLKQVMAEKETDIRYILPRVLANIFVFWTLKSSGRAFYDAQKEGKDGSDFLQQPHAIQIISILHFTGCDKKDSLVASLFSKVKQLLGVSLDKLDNQLMQIKTGEGKSVILGCKSLLLAFMGHEVYCVCYSSDLSSRDFADFAEIFAAFKLDHLIRYGTFNYVAEIIINEEGNVRDATLAHFKKEKYQNSVQKNERLSRVLLVDEVDTFFSRDFYGALYNPVTLFANPDLVDVIDTIWKERDKSPAEIKDAFQKCGGYQNLKTSYSDCFKKLEEQFDCMAADVKNYDSIDYVVQNGKIGYKEQDGVSFTSVYGYKTMFLYMYENLPERGNVKDDELAEWKGVSLTCGQYSYAEVANKFDKIFGVTGTLEYLSEFQEKILKQYKIQRKSYAPSVYGDSRRIILPTLIEPNQEAHYQMIAGKLEESRKNNGAVLVFFENEPKLAEFLKSKYMDKFRAEVRVITEKTENRSALFKKATASGSITLLTAVFGRGVDFRVHDPIVKEQGLFVIQTFLSEEISEEVQVKGRTARQGTMGKFQLVLDLEVLDLKYKVTAQEIKKVKEDEKDSLEGLLHRKRVEYLREMNKAREKIVEQARKVHEESMKLREAVLAGSLARDHEMYFRNQSSAGGVARILIVIDSTGSMGSTLSQVKNKVMTMIDNLAKKYPSQFEVQIMFYYGFNSYDSQKGGTVYCRINKLHRSDWTNNTAVLRKFMESSAAGGGSAHQSVPLGLYHVLKSSQEVEVKQAILIGDAPYLLPSFVYCVHPDDRVRYKGREKEDIKQTINYAGVIDQLAAAGVKVNTYPIGDWPLPQFQNIADKTKGTCKPFDPDKDDLSAEIESTISSCIKLSR